MNFDDAIKAHMDWKVRLRAYIEGKSTEKLNASTVGMDNQCALGKWLYSDGAKWNTHAEYETLRAEHAKFHKAAAEVIKKVDAGDKTGASSALGGGDYVSASNKVGAFIVALRKKVEGK